jgi:hypothetical protein
MSRCSMLHHLSIHHSLRCGHSLRKSTSDNIQVNDVRVTENANVVEVRGRSIAHTPSSNLGSPMRGQRRGRRVESGFPTTVGVFASGYVNYAFSEL